MLEISTVLSNAVFNALLARRLQLLKFNSKCDLIDSGVFEFALCMYTLCTVGLALFTGCFPAISLSK